MALKNHLYIKKNQSYLNYLLKIRKDGFHVSESIALIRQNNLHQQDVDKRFIPSNKFQGLM